MQGLENILLGLQTDETSKHFFFFLLHFNSKSYENILGNLNNGTDSVIGDLQCLFVFKIVSFNYLIIALILIR